MTIERRRGPRDTFSPPSMAQLFLRLRDSSMHNARLLKSTRGANEAIAVHIMHARKFNKRARKLIWQGSLGGPVGDRTV